MGLGAEVDLFIAAKAGEAASPRTLEWDRMIPGADGVIVASALVDALGPNGRDVVGLTRLVRDLRA